MKNKDKEWRSEADLRAFILEEFKGRAFPVEFGKGGSAGVADFLMLTEGAIIPLEAKKIDAINRTPHLRPMQRRFARHCYLHGTPYLIVSCVKGALQWKAERMNFQGPNGMLPGPTKTYEGPQMVMLTSGDSKESLKAYLMVFLAAHTHRDPENPAPAYAMAGSIDVGENDSSV